MLLVKSFHVIFVVIWCAGLLSLPRLFIYHITSEDQTSIERLKIMEQELAFRIMAPSGVLTILSGTWLIFYSDFIDGWLAAKLALVSLMVLYNVYCNHLLANLIRNRNRHSQWFYRMLNHIPLYIIIGVIFLVVSKPF